MHSSHHHHGVPHRIAHAEVSAWLAGAVEVHDLHIRALSTTHTNGRNG